MEFLANFGFCCCHAIWGRYFLKEWDMDACVYVACHSVIFQATIVVNIPMVVFPQQKTVATDDIKQNI